MGASILPDLGAEILIPFCAVVGIAFSLLQWVYVSRIQLSPARDSNSYSAGKNGCNDYLIEEEEGVNDNNVVQKCAEIQNAISEGATSFLFTEYKYVGAFMVAFAILIFVFLGSVEGFSTSSHTCANDETKMCKPALATAVFSTVSFLLGAITSVVSGFLGMKIATYANARTTLEARKGVGKAFIVAFRSGAVMGFLLAANGLLVLYIVILVFKMYYGEDWGGLFESITGYGLGGSSMALFGRVGGGIYTKAADVGADLVGKVERNIPEDDPRNPAVIADNVGDNVGDIAGMGSDLFGSYAESSCAALVVASISSFGINHELTAMLYPLIVSSIGIIVCLITTLFATDFFEIKAVKEIEPALKRQLIISTVLMTVGVAIVTWISVPSSFTIFNFGTQKVVKNWQLFLCVCVGLWAGLIIGFVTEYYTSNAYSPVQDVADSCRTGAATNVIFGLALGYKSVIIPIFAIAISIYVSFSFAAMYGIAVAALGMLSTIATGLAIDAYGPISDNAGGIAEMAGMSHRIRERTDALDAAGNTTAAIGKGFAIGSAALVSLALFGAFVSRAGIATVDVLTPKVFIGLIVGAMLPYWFSAMTMKSVGSAALKMVEEVRRQFNTIPGLMEGTAKPDYATCVKISTDASIKEMIPPGALVMLTPLIVGIFFGVETLSGVLAGSLVSGVQIAISASNTGGAWDNAKKYIEAGASEHARSLGPKGSDPHKAAVIGDTVGDPLKDTSGPSLNILIKLMAVESLVFAPFFATHGGLLFNQTSLSTMPPLSLHPFPPKLTPTSSLFFNPQSPNLYTQSFNFYTPKRRRIRFRSLEIKSLDAAQVFDYETKLAAEFRSSQSLKIAIIGFGNFGQFLAKTLTRQGHTVLAHSRSDHSSAAAALGVSFFPDPHDLCEQHPHVILLSTSILSAAAVLSSLPLQRLRRSTLFVDVLSVKEFSKSLLLRSLPPYFDLLCTHPMFGPESAAASWNGLFFVYDKVRIGADADRAARCDKFLSIFEREGCSMVEMSCAEHDRHAAGSQFITHTVGRVLGMLRLEPTPINTRGYETLLDLVENTQGDSFDLYYGLFVYNKNALEMLERLDLAFEALKQQLFGRLHDVVRDQLFGNAGKKVGTVQEECVSQNGTALVRSPKAARLPKVRVADSSEDHSRLKIGIVGFGNFGQFLAKTIVRQGHRVLAYSRTDYCDVAQQLGVSYFLDADDFCEEHPEVILLCTSILSTEKVLMSLPLQRLKRSTLFVDVLSVKEFPRSLFLQNLPLCFDILCTHPMFGPESGKNGWNGLAFVYDRVRIGNDKSRVSRCDQFLDIFAQEECRMVEMSCEEHDKHAAGSQFITHTMGRVLEKLGLESTPVNTKGYKTLLNLVENTAGDSFDLYYGLFMYNVNAMEQLKRLDLAFESLKKQLFGRLHGVLRTQLFESADDSQGTREPQLLPTPLDGESSTTSFLEAFDIQNN
ncbi:pyrophosphate-energized vacuolar membrane proton pump-like [Argentina anserina]|uniref:pyrophosphate-energized vacuolar membrane proton pump-like n=1 Tax=Argentina anserina TaxID=57926 RepID=UPI0021765AA2|nr:pyrophosphate-energized vacuolar membrane proton pump-like [Potentilla anserina]